MKDLATITTTMTSLEIAELTGKQHKNVMRDIRKMLKELEIDALKYEHSYLNKQNKEQPMFELDERLTLALVSGYNDKLRIKVIDRLRELEKRALIQMQPSGPTDNEVALAKIKADAEVKLAEINAKIALSKKPTNIRRIPDCPKDYIHMKAFERYLEDQHQPVPISCLKKIAYHYVKEINQRGNCMHFKMFLDVLNSFFTRLDDDGAYWKDPESKIRVLKTKVQWYS